MPLLIKRFKMQLHRICKMVIVIAGLFLLYGVWWKMEPYINGTEVTICINEICDNNFSTVPIVGHEGDDWIELYNASEEAIFLKGWTISDSENDLKKYELPEMVLESKEFYVLYANGEGEESFLNFRLSQGESVFLVSPEGEVIDSVMVPEMDANTTYARVTDGLDEWRLKYATYCSTNNDSLLVLIEEVESPTFSMEGGFYTGSNYLELSVEDENCEIYYTTDGSVPTEESIWYTEPILIENRSDEPNGIADIKRVSIEEKYQYGPNGPVDKISVIRAIAIDSKGNKSEVMTQSYIVDIQNELAYNELPIVSLVVNPDDFFNAETGLYVVGNEYERQLLVEQKTGKEIEVEPNYKQCGRQTEREGNVEIYHADQTPMLKQKVGVRVHGESTRVLPQKSFSIYAREMYDGKDVFEENIFGEAIDAHKVILSGGYDSAKIRQELNSLLLDERAIDTQKFIRCNVFLNGEYWGVYWIAEVFDERFIENYYGIPKEEVLIEESAWPQELIEITENRNGLSNEELYQALAEKIDIQSCIDHYASMIYINHEDWFIHNAYMWRSTTVSEDNEYQDGKWRWMVYDTEGSGKGQDVNTFQEGKNTIWAEDPIIHTLMLDDEFCRRFVTTFMDIANTVFEIDHVTDTTETVYSSFKPAVEVHAMRWNHEWAEEMDEKVEKLIAFYEERFQYIVPYMQEEFSIKDELAAVSLEISDESKGSVVINTSDVRWKNNNWIGYYFMNYPIKLTAKEKEDVAFIGWYDVNGNLISKEEVIEIVVSENNYYKAVFE